MKLLKGKYAFSFACAVAVLFVATHAGAAPVGNPAKDLSGENGEQFSIGYVGDMVFERDLDDSTELETNSHAAKISYAAMERVEVFALLGIVDVENSGTLSGTSASLESDIGFLWGVGGTLALGELDNGLRFGLTGSYRASNPDLDKAVVGGTTVVLTDSEFDYEDWTVALGAAYPTDWGNPYVGLSTAM